VLIGAGADMYAALHQPFFDHGGHVHERFDGDPDDPFPEQLAELSAAPGQR
jgi:hypothetical protein